MPHQQAFHALLAASTSLHPWHVSYICEDYLLLRSSFFNPTQGTLKAVGAENICTQEFLCQIPPFPGYIMSRLENLPHIVRYEILRYLLLADRVRQPPNHLLVEHYVFQVNILRVSRSMREDSTAILYGENTFVQVNNHFTDAEKSMRNHEVPFFLAKRPFKHHAAQVTVAFDPMNKRMPSSVKMKKSLTSRAFDVAILNRVKTAMTQKVSWLRGGAWEIHDIAVSIKRKGDWAFRLKNADMALAKYEDSRTFLDTALKLNSMMQHTDVKFLMAVNEFGCIVWTDTALLMLADIIFEEAGKRCFYAVPNMVPHIQAAEQSQNKLKGNLSPTTLARFTTCLGKTTRDGYETAKVWVDLDKKARKTCLDAMLSSLPAEPLSIPDLETYMTPEVGSEHWIMRELGFEGPIPFEDKIKGSWNIVLTDKPHPNHHKMGSRTAQIGMVKPEVLRKHLKKYRYGMNLPQAQGRLMCWVGLHVDEIGEETCLDDPEYIHARLGEGYGWHG
ncbi:hypothetical protein EK21DRAFT_117439 [Setomelanomma holmii]|uniref:Uncharacterized protein n=1 Tax=Setomelanomma holmii TaxID=210430 RepID=A0A9P4GZH6_9PLEO|nr:hypothetical protein EK21DRAFT_117439 [Setomelanomma holmii]